MFISVRPSNILVSVVIRKKNCLAFEHCRAVALMECLQIREKESANLISKYATTCPRQHGQAQTLLLQAYGQEHRDRIYRCQVWRMTPEYPWSAQEGKENTHFMEDQTTSMHPPVDPGSEEHTDSLNCQTVIDLNQVIVLF